MKLRLSLSLSLLAALLLAVTSLEAQVLCTQSEALARAFPNATKTLRRTLFLTQAQTEAIEKAAQSKLESKLVTFYVDSTASGPTGYVFFDKSTVRTKDEVLMIVLTREGAVAAVEVLAFYEPFDYLPPPRWLKLFQEKILNDNLWPNRDIHAITGATLSVRAVTFSVRRVLATFAVAVSPRKAD